MGQFFKLSHCLVHIGTAALRRTLERALGAMGYDVVSVGDPLLVYELLDAADYDLVILDIHLPQLSGDALAIALLRRLPRLAERLLLMTGDPWALRADWPDELRRCPLLVKPFTLDGLAAMVRGALAPTGRPHRAPRR